MFTVGCISIAAMVLSPAPDMDEMIEMFGELVNIQHANRKSWIFVYKFHNS